ncbi:MAG: hypothetical protein IH944_11520 [Armatimonadetes bacterium]|nr:hypothetical protein [Armatimonadota bacterium]
MLAAIIFPLFVAFGLVPVADMSTVPTVAVVDRLAHTPELDGVLSADEWDQFEADSGMQWEPGKLHWSAVVPSDFDVLLSLDLNADGWLVGDDNIEVRISRTASGTMVSTSRLDATNRDGPVWIPSAIPGHLIERAQSAADYHWTLEASMDLDRKRFMRQGDTIGVRIDAVRSGASLGPAYAPRRLAYVNLVLDQGLNDADISWKVGARFREVAREDGLKMRFDLQRRDGSDVGVESVDIRFEGDRGSDLAAISRPFGRFDSRGKARLEYESAIAGDASTGYRILKAELKRSDGSVTVLRASFRINDLVQFEVSIPRQVTQSQVEQVVKGHVYIRSTGTGRIKGVFSARCVDGWQINRGGNEEFLIFHPRGRQRIPIEITIPAYALGAYPIRLEARIGERVIEQIAYIEVAARG